MSFAVASTSYARVARTVGGVWLRPAPTCARCASTAAAAAPSASPDASSPQAQQPQQPTTHFRITLRRSAIGMPEKKVKIVESLGLKKRLQSVYRAQSPTIAGSILAVKELLHVENVRRPSLQPEDDFLPDNEARWVDEQGQVVDWGREAKKAPSGYQVVGNRLQDQ